ncbi:hypothetical protein PS708_00605 [Pseudomonas fluorescens]|nr:hypothetical protein PS708_00605 [Pseudomonas fluorescens]
MKKLNKDKIEYFISAGRRRHARFVFRSTTTPAQRDRLSRRKQRHKKKLNTGSVEAPSKLDIYSPKNHSIFLKFIENLRRSIKNNKTTFISFKNSYRITAAAGLLLVAETDRLTKAYPEAIIKCSFPPTSNEGVYKNNFNVVESALNQIGFFKLIKQQCQRVAKYAHVEKWHQLSGDTADGSLAQSLLNSLPDSIPKRSKQKLYRGAIEAIANSVEHAYPSIRNDGVNTVDTRWWMLVGLDDFNLTVIICDLGVGIPETLPKKHPASLLNLIKSKFSIFDSSDSELIRASTHIKETRTLLDNRGKGGKDFRSIAKNFPSATLIVRSNRGAFFLTGEDSKPLKKTSSRRYVDGTNRRESTLNHAYSIRGTLTEWIVPLQDIVK